MTKSGVEIDDPGAKSPPNTSLRSIVRGDDKDDDSVGNGQETESLEPSQKESECVEDEDSGSVSGSSDNERVREKLKKTTIANVRPESSAASESQEEGKEPKAPDSAAVSETDLEMGEEKTRRTRKRSIEETDSSEDVNMGNEGPGKGIASRHRVHERKRSREISDEDMAKAARALNRVKTPPTHPEEDEIMGHNEGLNSAGSAMTSLRKLERKRSRNRFDGDDKDKDADRRKKMVGERKEDPGMNADTATLTNELTNGKAFDTPEAVNPSPTETDLKPESKIPISSGFSNTSTKSPFATASVGSKPLFGGSGSPDMFKKSAFGAMSGSPASPFATLGSMSHSPSPFGSLGGTVNNPSSFTSGFGNSYGPSGFGSLAGKAGDVISSAPKLSGPIGGGVAKPFGAPDDDDEKTDDEDGEGSGGDSEAHKEHSSGKETFTQQEVATGEEGEDTIFKCPGKIFSFDKENKVWKERGKGTFKLNTKGGKPATTASAFGLDDDDVSSATETNEKKSARILMRTDGTYTLILNVPIFKGMRFGDAVGNKPAGSQLLLTIPNSGGSFDSMTLKVKSATHAKELYDQLKTLQEELFP